MLEKWIIRSQTKPIFTEDLSSPELHKGSDGIEFFSSLLKKHETFGLIVRVYQYGGFSGNETYYVVAKTGLLYCWNGKDKGQWFKYRDALSEENAPSGWCIEGNDFGLLPHDYVRKHFERKESFQG